MTIHLHKGDLPDGLDLGKVVAIDTETMGLVPHRDRLCLVQLSSGDGDAHLVQMPPGPVEAPNLKALVADQEVLKLFHFGRFDIAVLARALGVAAFPVYCTKIASKLCRTYTDRHSLKHLCSELLGVELSKQQQTSDWGAEELDASQQEYAASDVLYLHKLRGQLDLRLARENRIPLAEACFRFLPSRAILDLKRLAGRRHFRALTTSPMNSCAIRWSFWSPPVDAKSKRPSGGARNAPVPSGNDRGGTVASSCRARLVARSGRREDSGSGQNSARQLPISTTTGRKCPTLSHIRT